VKDITDDAFQNWTKAEKTVPFLKYWMQQVQATLA
jgi:hypothetical protein